MKTKKIIVWSLLLVALVIAVASDASVDIKKKKEGDKQVEIPTVEGKTDVEEHKESNYDQQGYGQGGDMNTNEINDDLDDDVNGYGYGGGRGYGGGGGYGGGRGYGGGGWRGGRGWGGGGRGWGGGGRGWGRGGRGWGGGGRGWGGGGGWRGGGGGWRGGGGGW